MDDLKQVVQNAVYEQKDPLLVYKFEAFELFKRMLAKVNHGTSSFLFKADVPVAAEAGFANFQPEACLINQYVPGAKLSLHQDKDERDLRAPIVSLSLGLPAVFLFGTPKRKDRTQRYRLVHGDVVVWGGPSRLAYHGVMPLADGEHVPLGRRRINLTFRRAG